MKVRKLIDVIKTVMGVTCGIFYVMLFVFPIAGVIFFAVLKNVTFKEDEEVKAEENRQRRIVNDLRNLLISDCKEMGDATPISSPITVHGKILVWNMMGDYRSGANVMLPQELQAISSDRKITVFMVLREREVLVGRYTLSGQPAYRRYVDVCVAYWPETKAVGMHSVLGAEPPSSRPVRHSPEYGDYNEPIAKWIQALGRAR